MKRALIFLGILFLTLVFVQRSDAEIYSTISGHVVEDGTNNPVAGLTVSAVRMDGTKAFTAKGVTDQKGLYVIRDVVSGTYSVSLKKSAEYYSDKPVVEVKVIIRKNIVNNNFTVKKAGSVSGRILQGDGTTPYVNVSVIADVPQGGYQLFDRTDANGFYKIAGLPDSDNAVVGALIAGIGLKYKGGIKIVGGQETKNVNIVVLKDASNLSMKGRVLAEGSNTPVANIVILITGKESLAQVATDANGSFEVYGLPPGSYDVMIAPVKYEFYTKKGLEIIAGAPPLEVNFILKPVVGSQSKMDSPANSSFLSSCAQRLLSLDFSIVGEAYAADTCEKCACSSKEMNDLVSKYEKNAATYPGSSIFNPFANALSCVSDGLRNACQNFDSPKQLLSTMQCLQDKALAHDSGCWQYARQFCEREELTTVPIWPLTAMARSGCTLAQESCETQDRGVCWTLGEISIIKNSDGWKATKEALKCVPSIGYDLL